MEKITYTKADLISEIAADLGKTKKETKEFLEAVSPAVKRLLSKTTPDCNIEVKGIDGVVFKGGYTEARVGRNPQTGESITIAPSIKVKASFTPSFKAAVNGGEE